MPRASMPEPGCRSDRSVARSRSRAEFHSPGCPVSSSAVTETEAVRFACAVNSKKSAAAIAGEPRSPPPPCGSAAGCRVGRAASGMRCAISLPSIRMSRSAFEPFATVTTTGANEPEGATWVGAYGSTPERPVRVERFHTQLVLRDGLPGRNHQLAQIVEAFERRYRSTQNGQSADRWHPRIQ